MVSCCCGNNPTTPELTGEVNRDGLLNIFDLILAAKNFGTTDYGIVDAYWIGINNIKMSSRPTNLV